MQLRKFPSIDQLRHVVAAVTHRAEYVGQDANDEPMYDHSRRKPVLTFHGTVKLHGSNCGIAFDLLNHTVEAQSRERILSVEEDNMGFCAWAQSPEGAGELAQLRPIIRHGAAAQLGLRVVAARVFGEWCGIGVNGMTGIGKLPVRWVVFGVLATLEDGSEQWLTIERVAANWAEYRRGSTPSRIYFSADFPRYRIDIDFNAPEASLAELEALTLAVEAECPVAKAMGGTGIGEGIVWTCQDPTYGYHVFKTKGEKHKGTKNSRLVQIAPEVLAGLDAFTDAVLTESRLMQGFDLLRADFGKVTLDHVGPFLQWIGQDVLKEESDTLAASGLERKQVMGRINARAKAWLMPRLAKV